MRNLHELVLVLLSAAAAVAAAAQGVRKGARAAGRNGQQKEKTCY